MSDKKEYDVSELAAYDSDEDVAVAEAGNKDGDVKKYATKIKMKKDVVISANNDL